MTICEHFYLRPDEEIVKKSNFQRHPQSLYVVKSSNCAGEAFRVLLFDLSGHGNFDMQAYVDYPGGKLKDAGYPAEKIKEALSKLPEIPG